MINKKYKFRIRRLPLENVQIYRENDIGFKVLSINRRILDQDRIFVVS